MKFGGSSVESADAIKRVAGIVKSQAERNPVVVVSAMGKTTNKLLEMARLAVGQDKDYIHKLDELRRYHWEHGMHAVESSQLEQLTHILESHFSELSQLLHGLAILGELTPRSIDVISSYGERLSSLIVALAFNAQGLPATHIDSRDVLITDDRHTQANPDFKETYKRMKQVVGKAGKKNVVVMGGFIASTSKGQTTTLGRGGSDYSASIIGAGIGADEIQIWTDVDGMMTTDPRLIPHAIPIDSISFAEAAELAYFGAKVLHPATVRPAVEKDIAVVILNSRNPLAPGTRIIKDSVTSEHVVRAFACKRDITLVNIHSATMFMTHGFLRRVFEVFDRYQTSIDMVTTSEVNVSMTVENTEKLSQVKKELEKFADVEVEKKLAIVSIVGNSIGTTEGVAARIFKALETVNVRMISQGASLLNLSIVIAESDLEAAMKALHAEWFGK
ncbi:MAG TPA: lysine-sensitive aspartokinase 3 [Fimbriimonadaceae bacterium]|jgi:aspartate kinase